MVDDGEVALDQTYLRLLRRVIIRISCISRDLMEPLALTPPQALTLLIVREREGITQVSLVKALESDPNTVSGIVRRLEQRELIRRERGRDDGRSITLWITPAGADLARRAQAAYDRLAAALEQTVPKRSAGTIASWLRSILTIHEMDVD